MTGSRDITIAGAKLTATVAVYPETIKIDLTLDLSPLDNHEPDHSPHNLINYISLPNYHTGNTYWWCKLHRAVKVNTGSQANRVIRHAIARIDDAIHQAIIDRDARKAHMITALSAID